jgi:NAD(P)-dependent dehydrogenase (short-subunit alcohol dehydrogenase family)
MTSSNRFDGMVAVVTGAASGLGAASARRLAEEGASIVAVDRDERIVDAARDLPGEAIGVVADISDEADVDAYMAAGIFGSFAPLPDLAADDFEHVMRVNVTGQFLGLRAAFRHYRQTRTRGAVAVTASIAGHRGSADLLPYQTSKHAVVGLVHGAAVYGGPLGIRVNAVAPGIVPTQLFADAASTAGGGNDMVQRASTTPLRRAGSADEIAGVVAFLLSDDSSYMTGEVVSADGGASIVNRGDDD